MEKTARQPDDGAMVEWVVVFEAVPPPLPMGKHMQCLLGELADLDPVGMHCDERYALQLRVLGVHPEEALTTALAKWRSAAERLLLGTAMVVRSEVMTRRELEHDIRAASNGEPLVATATAIQHDPVARRSG